MAAVAISATAELEAARPSIDDQLAQLEARLNALSLDEVVAVIDGVTRALAPAADEPPAVIAALAGDRRFAPEERAEAELDVLMRSFARRRDLLAGSLTTGQVARLLNTSRQTPHDRVASGTLLAVMERGALRFPAWQFDPDGDDGVVAGLPRVIRALNVSPLAKISWLTRPNVHLDGATPLSCLKAGQIERVVALARAVGVD
jgi:hypothetical protein